MASPQPHTSAYIPGICNINPREIARRRRAGYLGLAIFVALLAILVLYGLPTWSRVILFIPAILSTLGFLQAQKKFCVAYGAAGTQNATSGSEHASAIPDHESVATDKKRARQLKLQAAAIAAIITLLTLLIPGI
jgi:hypothetical protein